jgi:L-alanine-DL-glutamate epimerase-like enolase superfamily enzyme
VIQLKYYRFELPLKHKFTIARGSRAIQPTLIIELSDGQHRGFGEATASGYYDTTVEKLIAAVESVRQEIEQSVWEQPHELWQQLQPHLAQQPFAACALDEAAHDLWGKRRGAPVYRLWGLTPERTPCSNYTIGIDTVDLMVQKMLEVPGWPIYKIKLGTPHDLEIVRELRRHTDALFRVDANCGWTTTETIHNSHELKPLGVEFIEQPLPADCWHDMRTVFQQSALPVVADESCQVVADVEKCAGCFHGINIKLVKCGGLTPARRMVEQARALGLKVMVGCMTESTVGISAIAQLLPLLDYVDMDGAALLAADIASGVRVEQGRCIYPRANGNGVQLL